MNAFHTQLLSVWVLCRPWYSVGMQIGTIAKVIFGLGTRDQTCWLAKACKTALSLSRDLDHDQTCWLAKAL